MTHEEAATVTQERDDSAWMGVIAVEVLHNKSQILVIDYS